MNYMDELLKKIPTKSKADQSLEICKRREKAVEEIIARLDAQSHFSNPKTCPKSCKLPRMRKLCK